VRDSGAVFEGAANQDQRLMSVLGELAFEYRAWECYWVKVNTRPDPHPTALPQGKGSNRHETKCHPGERRDPAPLQLTEELDSGLRRNDERLQTLRLFSRPAQHRRFPMACSRATLRSSN